MSKENEKIAAEFLGDLLALERPTKSLFVVWMAGLQGSGKSSVARKLAKRLGVSVASNDTIRGFLSKRGIFGQEQNELMEEIIHQRRKAYLGAGISYIHDADTRPHWKKVQLQCDEYDARSLLVRVDCSENVILKRLRERIKGEDEYNAGVEDYWKRKKLWEELEPPKEFYFVVNSEENVDDQIEELVVKMRRDGLVE